MLARKNEKLIGSNSQALQLLGEFLERFSINMFAWLSEKIIKLYNVSLCCWSPYYCAQTWLVLLLDNNLVKSQNMNFNMTKSHRWEINMKIIHASFSMSFRSITVHVQGNSVGAMLTLKCKCMYETTAIRPPKNNGQCFTVTARTMYDHMMKNTVRPSLGAQ